MGSKRFFNYQTNGGEMRRASFTRDIRLRELAERLGNTNHVIIADGRRVEGGDLIREGVTYNFVEMVKGNTSESDDIFSAVQDMSAEDLVRLLRVVFSRIIGERTGDSGSGLQVDDGGGLELNE